MFDDRASVATAAGMRLAQAGVRWDVVKVRRFLGLQAIEHIEQPGAVAVDPHSPEPMLYFFVPAGTLADWDVPDTRALNSTECTTHVVLPPGHREAPPGPYWLLPPSCGLTPTDTLHRALERALHRPDPHPHFRIDTAAMRADAAQLIGDAAELPESTVLPQLVQRLRGHLMVLVPHVEDRMRAFARTAETRLVAQVTVGEAQRRLNSVPGLTFISEIKHAQTLARSVEALCRHAEVPTHTVAKAPAPTVGVVQQ
ncbi:DUF6415 family natural product biosynthesis protein [Streptomyces mirabilis]|uniref:DUF6415 family natural product biosynthesis protein n=2 Tax=Streptomyces mirabilis TaxID=68239 RepID=UPI003692D5BF